MTAPGGQDKHRHCATIASDGDGLTAAAADGHVHRVEDLRVLAGGADSHTHTLSAQRCPAEHHRGRCVR